MITDFFGGVQTFEMTDEGYPMNFRKQQNQDRIQNSDVNYGIIEDKIVERTDEHGKFLKRGKIFSDRFILAVGGFTCFIYGLSIFL